MNALSRRGLAVLLAAVTLIEQAAVPAGASPTIWLARPAAVAAPLFPSVGPMPLAGALSPVSSSADASRFGTIRSVAAGRGPGVVIVEDIHANAEAQSNIAGLLGQYAASGPVWVGVEGAEGPLSFARFARFPVPSAIVRVADALVRSGALPGPVRAALAAPDRVSLVGIDDAGEHARNVAAFRQSDPLRPAALSDIARRQAANRRARAARFNGELARWSAAWDGYHGGGVPLTAYVETLLSFGAGGAEMRRLAAAQGLEARLDWPAVRRDRDRLVARLSQKPAARAPLADLARRARERAASPADIEEGLTRLAGANGEPLGRYPAFADYLNYARLADGLDADRLLREMSAAEETLTERRARSSSDATLLSEARFLELARRLVDRSLGAADWHAYRRLAPAHRFAALGPFESFYASAERRDEAMARRFLAAWDRHPAGTAVLVAGGFHSEGLLTALRSRGVPATLFVPRVSRVSAAGGTAYLNAFLAEKTPLDRLFEGRRLYLAPDPGASLPLLAAGALALAPRAEAAADLTNGAALLSHEDATVGGRIVHRAMLAQNGRAAGATVVEESDGTLSSLRPAAPSVRERVRAWRSDRRLHLAAAAALIVAGTLALRAYTGSPLWSASLTWSDAIRGGLWALAIGTVLGGRGRGLALLVEDDSALQDVVRYNLERAGFRVLQASRGAEAIGLLKEHRGEWAAVVLDVKLAPEPDGRRVDGGAVYAAMQKDPALAAVTTIVSSALPAEALAAAGIPANALTVRKGSVRDLLRVLSDRIPPAPAFLFAVSGAPLSLWTVLFAALFLGCLFAVPGRAAGDIETLGDLKREIEAGTFTMPSGPLRIPWRRLNVRVQRAVIELLAATKAGREDLIQALIDDRPDLRMESTVMSPNRAALHAAVLDLSEKDFRDVAVTLGGASLNVGRLARTIDEDLGDQAFHPRWHRLSVIGHVPPGDPAKDPGGVLPADFTQVADGRALGRLIETRIIYERIPWDVIWRTNRPLCARLVREAAAVSAGAQTFEDAERMIAEQNVDTFAHFSDRDSRVVLPWLGTGLSGLVQFFRDQREAGSPDAIRQMLNELGLLGERVERLEDQIDLDQLKALRASGALPVGAPRLWERIRPMIQRQILGELAREHHGPEATIADLTAREQARGQITGWGTIVGLILHHKTLRRAMEAIGFLTDEGRFATAVGALAAGAAALDRETSADWREAQLDLVATVADPDAYRLERRPALRRAWIALLLAAESTDAARPAPPEGWHEAITAALSLLDTAEWSPRSLVGVSDLRERLAPLEAHPVSAALARFVRDRVEAARPSPAVEAPPSPPRPAAPKARKAAAPRAPAPAAPRAAEKPKRAEPQTPRSDKTAAAKPAAGPRAKKPRKPAAVTGRAETVTPEAPAASAGSEATLAESAAPPAAEAPAVAPQGPPRDSETAAAAPTEGSVAGAPETAPGRADEGQPRAATPARSKAKTSAAEKPASTGEKPARKKAERPAPAEPRKRKAKEAGDAAPEGPKAPKRAPDAGESRPTPGKKAATPADAGPVPAAEAPSADLPAPRGDDDLNGARARFLGLVGRYRARTTGSGQAFIDMSRWAEEDPQFVFDTLLGSALDPIVQAFLASSTGKYFVWHIRTKIGRLAAEAEAAAAAPAPGSVDAIKRDLRGALYYPAGFEDAMPLLDLLPTLPGVRRLVYSDIAYREREAGAAPAEIARHSWDGSDFHPLAAGEGSDQPIVIQVQADARTADLRPFAREPIAYLYLHNPGTFAELTDDGVFYANVLDQLEVGGLVEVRDGEAARTRNPLEFLVDELPRFGLEALPAPEGDPARYYRKVAPTDRAAIEALIPVDRALARLAFRLEHSPQTTYLPAEIASFRSALEAIRPLLGDRAAPVEERLRGLIRGAAERGHPAPEEIRRWAEGETAPPEDVAAGSLESFLSSYLESLSATVDDRRQKRDKVAGLGIPSMVGIHDVRLENAEAHLREAQEWAGRVRAAADAGHLLEAVREESTAPLPAEAAHIAAAVGLLGAWGELPADHFFFVDPESDWARCFGLSLEGAEAVAVRVTLRDGSEARFLLMLHGERNAFDGVNLAVHEGFHDLTHPIGDIDNAVERSLEEAVTEYHVRAAGVALITEERHPLHDVYAEEALDTIRTFQRIVGERPLGAKADPARAFQDHFGRMSSYAGPLRTLDRLLAAAGAEAPDVMTRVRSERSLAPIFARSPALRAARGWADLFDGHSVLSNELLWTIVDRSVAADLDARHAAALETVLRWFAPVDGRAPVLARLEPEPAEVLAHEMAQWIDPVHPDGTLRAREENDGAAFVRLIEDWADRVASGEDPAAVLGDAQNLAASIDVWGSQEDFGEDLGDELDLDFPAWALTAWVTHRASLAWAALVGGRALSASQSAALAARRVAPPFETVVTLAAVALAAGAGALGPAAAAAFSVAAFVVPHAARVSLAAGVWRVRWLGQRTDGSFSARRALLETATLSLLGLAHVPFALAVTTPGASSLSLLGTALIALAAHTAWTAEAARRVDARSPAAAVRRALADRALFPELDRFPLDDLDGRFRFAVSQDPLSARLATRVSSDDAVRFRSPASPETPFDRVYAVGPQGLSSADESRRLLDELRALPPGRRLYVLTDNARLTGALAAAVRAGRAEVIARAGGFRRQAVLQAADLGAGLRAIAARHGATALDDLVVVLPAEGYADGGVPDPLLDRVRYASLDPLALSLVWTRENLRSALGFLRRVRSAA